MKTGTARQYFEFFVVIVLCISMLLSLAACNSKKSKEESKNEVKSEETKNEEKTEEKNNQLSEVEEEEEPLPDFCTLIAEANQFTMEMMYGGEYLDYESPVTVKKTNDYGTYFEELYLLSYPGINSIEEFRAELSKYYTDTVVEEMLARDYWEEIEGKLYRASNGIGGGPMANNAKLIINKIDDNRYEITIDWFSGDVVFRPDDYKIYRY